MSTEDEVEIIDNPQMQPIISKKASRYQPLALEDTKSVKKVSESSTADTANDSKMEKKPSATVTKVIQPPTKVNFDAMDDDFDIKGSSKEEDSNSSEFSFDTRPSQREYNPPAAGFSMKDDEIMDKAALETSNIQKAFDMETEKLDKDINDQMEGRNIATMKKKALDIIAREHLMLLRDEKTLILQEISKEKEDLNQSYLKKKKDLEESYLRNLQIIEDRKDEMKQAAAETLADREEVKLICDDINKQIKELKRQQSAASTTCKSISDYINTAKAYHAKLRK